MKNTIIKIIDFIGAIILGALAVKVAINSVPLVLGVIVGLLCYSIFRVEAIAK